MHHVRPAVAQHSPEGGLGGGLLQVELREARPEVEPDRDRRAEQLEHRHPAPTPAVQAQAADQWIAPPCEEVRDVVAPPGLPLHHVLRVGDQPTSSPGPKAPPHVPDPHRPRHAATPTPCRARPTPRARPCRCSCRTAPPRGRAGPSSSGPARTRHSPPTTSGPGPPLPPTT